MADQGRRNTTTAEKADITLSRFYRLMAGEVPMLASEAAKLSEILGVDPKDIT